MSTKLKEASVKAVKGLGNSLPVLVGVVLQIKSQESYRL